MDTANLEPDTRGARHKRRLVVVGAGLSGLAAAYRLQESGFDVVVLESAAGPGGRSRTSRRDGFVIDHGPEIAAGSYNRFFQLAQDVGVGPLITPSSAIIGTVKNGRIVDTDASSLLSVLFSGAVSWRSKMRLVLGIRKVWSDMKDLDAYRMADWADLDDESLSADKRSRAVFGDEATDYLINPLIRMIAGATPERVSQLMLLGGLASWSTALQNIAGGLDTLVSAVAARLDIRYCAPATRVVDADGGVEVSYSSNGATETIFADGCLLACQLDDAARMSARVADFTAVFRQQMRYLGLIDVKLAYAAPTKSKAFACQVPSRESHGLLLYTLSQNKAPDRVPPGHSLFTVFTDDQVFTEFAAKTDAELEAWARAEMEVLYPEVKGRFLFSEVSRYAQAGYLADPGYFKRVAALVQHADQLGRIELGGDFYGAGSMEAAILWGERAAERLTRRLSAGTGPPAQTASAAAH